MQAIDFYKLSRPVQERFIGSVSGTGLPAPMLRVSRAPRAPLAWLGASLLAVVAALAVFRLGLGDLGSSLAIQGVPWLVAQIALVALAVFGVMRALAILSEHKKSPFRRGIYVFPVGLIDAQDPKLRLYPIEDLTNVVGPDARATLTLAFGGKTFAFPVDPEKAEAAKSGLASARGRIQEADAAKESVRPKALAALDPLQGFANPLVSSDPLKPDAPSWARSAWAFALGAGVVLGSSLWAIRNARSDDAMYERATAAADAESFKAYLARGSRHAAEVSTKLLPRAELLEAEKIGSVAAIEQYVKDHPQTNIGPEIAAALKAAMKKELDVAVQAGTLAALDDFTRRHPQSHLDAEVKAARHNVYQMALERYSQAASGKGTADVAFVQRLLSWAEAKGAPVEIRFHRVAAKAMDRADAAVEKHKFFRGVISVPSRYFDAAHDRPHEDALATAVIQHFAAVFPTEILALAVGEPIPETETQLPPQITLPTLFIEHGPSWNGSVVGVANPRGVYVGLGLQFTATFRVPDDTKPVKVKLDLWRSPDSDATKEDKPEESVYRKMDDDAFGQFQKRLLGTFFKAAK